MGAAAWAASGAGAGAACGSMALEGEASAASTEQLRYYKSKVRFLATNLRKPENSDLQKLALDGTVTGDDLVQREEEEFLPDAQLKQRRQDREEALRAVVLKPEPLELSDAKLTCAQCHHVGCRYSVLRDSWAVPRSGPQGLMRTDNGRCIQVQCPACGERWK